MKDKIHFQPDLGSSSSTLEMTVNRYCADIDVYVCMDDLYTMLDDVLSDWYCLSKEQQDKLREFFHDPVTYEE